MPDRGIRTACRKELDRLVSEHGLKPIRLAWRAVYYSEKVWGVSGEETRKMRLEGESLFEKRRIVIDPARVRTLNERLNLLRHEVAHFMTHDRGDDAPGEHEQRWQAYARDLGVPEDGIRPYAEAQATLDSVRRKKVP